MADEGMIRRVVAALGDRDLDHDLDRDLRPLAERLAAGLAAVRARWPQAPEAGDAFADHVAARLARQPDLAAAATRLHVEDLFLAWWASTGDPSGITTFEAACADAIELMVARFHKLPADDLRQRLRIKLFVGMGDAPPSIHGYNGSGALAGWLKVTAARAFVDATRGELRQRYEAELDEVDLLGLTTPGGTPRDRHAAAELAAAIKRAFAAAVAGLAPRERTFLRHASVDGLTLDQIAETYQVHRATVARTLKAARARLLAETREGVSRALGIDPAQLESALSMLDSKLDLSLSRVLRPAGA